MERLDDRTLPLRLAGNAGRVDHRGRRRTGRKHGHGSGRSGRAANLRGTGGSPTRSIRQACSRMGRDRMASTAERIVNLVLLEPPVEARPRGRTLFIGDGEVLAQFLTRGV